MNTPRLRTWIRFAALGTSLALFSLGCLGSETGEVAGGDGGGGGGGEESCWDFGEAETGECTPGEQRDCPDGFETEDGPQGSFCRQVCESVDGVGTWGMTTTDFQCPFYETKYHVGESTACQCNTPLVLSFDGAKVSFTEADNVFDLTRGTGSTLSDWPTAQTPWLALDRNGNGEIDDGGELFGSATRLADGSFARNGFEALRALDADQNGVFDERDPAFAKVLVWADRDMDRRSQPSELSTLAERGVRSIDLRDHRDFSCDLRGNCEGERSGFGFIGADGQARSGAVIDVYLRAR